MAEAAAAALGEVGSILEGAGAPLSLVLPKFFLSWGQWAAGLCNTDL